MQGSDAGKPRTQPFSTFTLRITLTHEIHFRRTAHERQLRQLFLDKNNRSTVALQYFARSVNGYRGTEFAFTCEYTAGSYHVHFYPAEGIVESNVSVWQAL